MGKHTPGPWQAIPGKGNWVITTKDGRTIATVEEEQDARLIAASPDMLKALNAVAAVAELVRSVSQAGAGEQNS